MIRLLLPLALMGSGLAAGGLAIAALGGAPLLLSLPTDRYVPVHKFLVERFDPFMPICMVLALVSDAVLAVVAPVPAGRWALGGAAVLLVGVLAVSVLKNVPINRWVATLDPQSLPEDWERLDPRVSWRNWNLLRTALAMAALVLNAVAVGVLL